MPFKRFDEARPLATLAIVGLAWLLIPIGVKAFVRASFFELTAPITAGVSLVRDVQDYWGLRVHSKHELIEAGRDLARLNASYEFAVQQNVEQQAQVERLESLLRLPSYQQYRYEHARVARREFSGWWQRIIIRKGRNYGIPLGAPVIFSGGVVGRIAEVQATAAVVDLISSPSVRLAGVVEGDTRTIAFQGGINPTLGPAMGVVESVPIGIIATPKLPKRLVTSGFGGVFPPGLLLGLITRLEPSSDGLFQVGEVKLDERLGSLAEVTVLVPLAEQ